MSDIARAEPPSPLALIDKAISQGVSVEHLGKLFDLQERYEKQQAAKVFAEAITGFQAECPMVRKSRQATFKDKDAAVGQPKYVPAYSFASFDDVMDVARPLLAKFKIVVTFTSDHVAAGNQGGLKITCRVRVGTHTEETTLTIPVPNQMVVNDSQKYGAALAYAKRYGLCAALNIVTTDEDDDGANLIERLGPNQIQHLRDELKRTGTTEKAFLHWMASPNLESVLQRDYAKAADFLRRKADAKEGAAK